MNLEILHHILGYLAVGSSILPTLVLLFKRGNSISNYLKVYSIELFLINVTNLLLYTFTNIDQNNLFSIHLFVELTLIILIFRVYSTAKLRRFYNLLLFVIICVFGYSLSFSAEIRFSMFGLFCKLLLSFLSVFVIVNQYFKSEKDSLLIDGVFIFSSGVLIYNGIQIYITINYSLIKDQKFDLILMIWPIIQIGTVIYHTLISRALWILKS